VLHSYGCIALHSSCVTLNINIRHAHQPSITPALRLASLPLLLLLLQASATGSRRWS
jgi:hypothetical protein